MVHCGVSVSSGSFYFYTYGLLVNSVINHYTWCGLSANLECISEMCCTRLAENTGYKNYAKIAICAPSHNFVRLYLCN